MNPFVTLSAGVAFEAVASGREGAVLMARAADGSAPIVRSTTKYQRPHQWFKPAHVDLAAAIVAAAPVSGLRFNNALIEQYAWQYRAMGAHSDQAMDLEEGSHICLFSCYSDGVATDMRKLSVRDKATGEEQTFPLEHCSAVLFSVEDNARYLHRIVPVDAAAVPNGCVWLGITFRCSFRVVRYVDGYAYLSPGEELYLLRTKTDARAFYKERSQENASLVRYAYSPDVACCTVSPSDLMAPTD